MPVSTGEYAVFNKQGKFFTSTGVAGKGSGCYSQEVAKRVWLTRKWKPLAGNRKARYSR
jgi:hypothetical protein